MAIVQSYRGNAKKITLRVKRNVTPDDVETKRKKKKSDKTVRKVKLSSGKKPSFNLKVKRYETD